MCLLDSLQRLMPNIERAKCYRQLAVNERDSLKKGRFLAKAEADEKKAESLKKGDYFYNKRRNTGTVAKHRDIPCRTYHFKLIWDEYSKDTVKILL